MTLALLSWSERIDLVFGVLAALLAAGALARLLWSTPSRAENEALRRNIELLRGEAEDKARRLNELGAEKDHFQRANAAAESRADTLQQQLDSLPRYEDVIRLVSNSMQEGARLIVGELEAHDERANLRHEDAIAVLREIREEISDRS